MFFWKKKKKDAEDAVTEAFSGEEPSAIPEESADGEATAEDIADAVSEKEDITSEQTFAEVSESVNPAEAENAPASGEDEPDAATEDDADVHSEDTAEAVSEEPEKKKGFFRRLLDGMSKTRNNLADGLRSLFGGSNIDEDFYEELEEILIMADLGVGTTEDILTSLRAKVKEQKINNKLHDWSVPNITATWELPSEAIINILNNEKSHITSPTLGSKSYFCYTNSKIMAFTIKDSGVEYSSSITNNEYLCPVATLTFN